VSSLSKTFTSALKELEPIPSGSERLSNSASIRMRQWSDYTRFSQSVLHRKKEIGIRIALGASAPNVICKTIREGIVLAATGAMIGLPAGAM
jgi:hypothetical protein